MRGACCPTLVLQKSRDFLVNLINVNAHTHGLTNTNTNPLQPTPAHPPTHPPDTQTYVIVSIL